MKRLVSLLLVLVLAIGVVPMALAEDVAMIDDNTYLTGDKIVKDPITLRINVVSGSHVGNVKIACCKTVCFQRIQLVFDIFLVSFVGFETLDFTMTNFRVCPFLCPFVSG